MKHLFFLVQFLIIAVVTNAQLTLAYDVNPGTPGSSVSTLQVMNGKIYFGADNGINGIELWQYDTLTGNASMVHDIRPGNFSGMLYFVASNDFNACVLNGKLYFVADDSVNGIELWVYDGSNTPTMLANINTNNLSSSPHFFGVCNNKLYFSAKDPLVGRELFEYDPTSGPPQPVTDIYPGSVDANVGYIAVFNNKVYFSATSPTEGTELFVFDPSNNTTALVADVETGAQGSSPCDLFVVNDKLYFIANTAAYGYELYSYTGTGMPVRITDINAGSNNGVGNGLEEMPVFFNGRIYFVGNNGLTGDEVYSLDTGNYSVQMHEVVSGISGSTPKALTVYNNKLYFNATNTSGAELWVCDGVNFPSIAAELIVGPGSTNPLFMKVVGDNMYLSADNTGTGPELYKFYDATQGIMRVGLDMDISVYPVPADDVATISIKTAKAISFATGIYDMAGKLLYSVATTEYKQGNTMINIPMRSLAPGHYQYVLTDKTGGTLASGKMVKQ